MTGTDDPADPLRQPEEPPPPTGARDPQLSAANSQLTSRRPRGRPPHPDILTPREWEVLALLRERLTNREIAERLGVTLHAARYHVSEIISKLGVETREEAAAWQPEETPVRRWWQRLFAPLTLTKAAGIGLSLLVVAALGCSRTSQEGSEEREAEAISTTDEVTPFVLATDVWVVNADGSDLERLTNLEKPVLAGYSAAPAWSPDGTRIAFLAGSGSNYAESGHLYVMQADGTKVTQLALRRSITREAPGAKATAALSGHPMEGD